MKQGLILFAHGARDARWAAPLAEIAARIGARRPTLALRLAYLEHTAPDLAGAAGELAAAGCARIELLPLFIGAGAHLRAQLPRLLAPVQQQHPGVHFVVHAAIGEVEAVQEAVAAHALALLAAEQAA